MGKPDVADVSRNNRRKPISNNFPTVRMVMAAMSPGDHLKVHPVDSLVARNRELQAGSAVVHKLASAAVLRKTHLEVLRLQVSVHQVLTAARLPVKVPLGCQPV